MESRDSFASLESLWPGIWQMGPWRVPKSGHVTVTKIENLHIDTRRKKITDSKNAVLFDLRRKVMKLSRKNPFMSVASPGACERLAVGNRRSSSIHPSSYDNNNNNNNNNNRISTNWSIIIKSNWSLLLFSLKFV